MLADAGVSSSLANFCCSTLPLQRLCNGQRALNPWKMYLSRKFCWNNCKRLTDDTVNTWRAAFGPYCQPPFRPTPTSLFGIAPSGSATSSANLSMFTILPTSSFVKLRCHLALISLCKAILSSNIAIGSGLPNLPCAGDFRDVAPSNSDFPATSLAFRSLQSCCSGVPGFRCIDCCLAAEQCSQSADSFLTRARTTCVSANVQRKSSIL